MGKLFELYKVSAELETLMDIIDEDEGSVSDECLLDTWEALDGEFEYRADEVCRLIRNLEAEIAAEKNEKQRLENKIRSREKAVMKIKSQLAELMIKADKPKIKTQLFNINRVKLNGKLYVENKGCPDELKKEQIHRVPDTDKIRELLDSGTKAGFARYYNSLTIQ